MPLGPRAETPGRSAAPRRADYPLAVAIQDPREALAEHDATLSSIEKVLDVPAMREEVAKLEVEAPVSQTI